MPLGRAQRILPSSIRTHATVSISTDVTAPPLVRRARDARTGRAGPYRLRGRAPERDGGASGPEA
ncbi:hypothetical protein Smic_53870 [Streptomyces microflavus]|uniref:Uncharacterized protein n=1 Tax=Streptomyces microflavus TaxID=1919 RepID=A0A7J0CWC0_STRMI|nr:hypothetical protein Smic_53870 [Streptomyces microflavus]